MPETTPDPERAARRPEDPEVEGHLRSFRAGEEESDEEGFRAKRDEGPEDASEGEGKTR